MERVSSQPAELESNATAVAQAGVAASAVAVSVADELYAEAKAAECGLSRAQFAAVLQAVGARLHYGQAAGVAASASQQAVFLRGLHVAELALAHGCALGLDAAWERFVAMYRALLTQAAIAIAGSATVGHELAGSLYSDLYGLKQADGARRSPLASYSGRGSLMGWLRTTLAQRHVDHLRRTRRETSLETEEGTLDVAAPQAAPEHANAAAESEALRRALGRTLKALPAEDRFMLAGYFLDRQTLLQLARLLRVSEATVSRRLKRLTTELRSALLRNLQAGGLSRRAAEEALGADPRDIEINLRALLQTSQVPAFPVVERAVEKRGEL